MTIIVLSKFPKAFVHHVPTKADKPPLFSKQYYWPTSTHKSNLLFNVIPHSRQAPLRNGKESTFASLPVKYIWVWTVQAINKIICSSLPLSHSIHSPLLIIPTCPLLRSSFIFQLRSKRKYGQSRKAEGKPARKWSLSRVQRDQILIDFKLSEADKHPSPCLLPSDFITWCTRLWQVFNVLTCCHHCWAHSKDF